MYIIVIAMNVVWYALMVILVHYCMEMHIIRDRIENRDGRCLNGFYENREFSKLKMNTYIKLYINFLNSFSY